MFECSYGSFCAVSAGRGVSSRLPPSSTRNSESAPSAIIGVDGVVIVLEVVAFSDPCISEDDVDGRSELVSDRFEVCRSPYGPM